MIGVAGDVFVPATTTISVNDQVIWTWVGSFHSTTRTNTPTLWDSGVQNAPHAFTNTFTSAGSFPYFCSVHASLGMTGLVEVVGAGVPPVVTITNPPDGITLSSPASLILAATASAKGATVTNVQFFQGAASLGSVATSPYSVPVSGLGVGDYAFSAVAADSNGLRGTNSITVHVVAPVPIVLSAPQLLSPTDFRFDYSANTGLRYVIQQSSDLNAWVPIKTNMAVGGLETFDDTNVLMNPGFYRVGLLPNP